MSRASDNVVTVRQLQHLLGIKEDGWGAGETRRAMRERLTVRLDPTTAAWVAKVEAPALGGLAVDRSLRLPVGQYLEGEHRKSLIVLHHTVGGSARSTVDYWRSDSRRIATAYVVGRQGTIYEIFPPEKWAYHLGLKGALSRTCERRSLGIEIASEGGLTEHDGHLYAFGSTNPRNRYTGEVYDHGSEWRGFRYFAAYTPQAVASVAKLVRHLSERFNIPRVAPFSRTEFDSDLRRFAGIVGHCHLRSDKSDVHPGFDWRALGLKFVPAA